MNRSLVVVTNGNFFARQILDRLFREGVEGAKVGGVVIVTGDYRGLTGLASLRNVAAGTTLPYVAFKAAQIASFRFARILFPSALLDVSRLARAHGIATLAVERVDQPEALEFICGLEPDLLVSVSCPQPIRPPLLEVARLGGINIHASLLPAFAGIAPYFWVLARGEEETGISVHYMTQRLDQGNVLVQRRLPITPGMSSFSLFLALAQQGSGALVEAIGLALLQDNGKTQELDKRSYFSHPTSEAWRKMRTRQHRLARPTEILRAILAEARRTSPHAT